MLNKIIIITNMPTPYRIPLWDELAKQVNLEVICISYKEKSREWKTDKRVYINFLKSYHFFLKKRDWALHITVPFSLLFSLIIKNPSVLIITGYDSFQYWEALFYAKFFRKKTILWTGTTLLSSRSRNSFIMFLKRFFIKQFNIYYTYGTKATEYIKSFGINDENIVTGKNTVDTNFYKKNTSNFLERTDVIQFLFVGRLIEIKGLQHVIPVLSKLESKNWNLTIVGSGDYTETLKKMVNKYKLEKQIIFAGNKQKEEILKFYKKADVLLMPSYQEVWGLVLNEALASGLFCMASKYAGATYDLITEGFNGLVIDPKNEEELFSKISKVFELDFNKKEIRDAFNVNIENEAVKLLVAIKKGLNL